MNDSPSTHDSPGGGRFASRRPTETDLAGDPNLGTEQQRQWIRQLPGDCAVAVLDGQLHWLCELSSSLSTEQLDRVDPPHRWTVRQVFEHCADAERVFGERMMRVSAGDQTDLPTWDEDAYAERRFGLGNFVHLVNELAALRQANVFLLRRVVPAAWDRVGSVGGRPISLRGLAWITAGKWQHHFETVERRCGVSVSRGPEASY